jgi:hypothetical protein
LVLQAQGLEFTAAQGQVMAQPFGPLAGPLQGPTLAFAVGQGHAPQLFQRRFELG